MESVKARAALRVPEVGGKNVGGWGQRGQKQGEHAKIGLRVAPGFCLLLQTKGIF